MKKKYMSPTINVVKLDGKLMNDIAFGSNGTTADPNAECDSKRFNISFTDDDDDVTGW